ncbi:MAG: hypothetical protein U0768_09535 [Anaerolineae bacterium]
MRVLERRVQHKVPSQDKYWAWEKQWEAVEQRLGGYPPKRHYMLVSGRDPLGTMVWKREWESMAALEDGTQRFFDDPEAMRLIQDYGSGPVQDGEMVELYMVP